MYHEIDRKFLIEEMPDLSDLECVVRTRYFLQRNDLIEEFIQDSDGEYSYEIKTAISPHERTREKKVLTKEEFELLQEKATRGITRESYILSSESPRIIIKKYRGEYEGLVFAEVEFNTYEDSVSFEGLSWTGSEITDTPLGRDSQLLELDREHFLQILDTEIKRLHTDFESH